MVKKSDLRAELPKGSKIGESLFLAESKRMTETEGNSGMAVHACSPSSWEAEKG